MCVCGVFIPDRTFSRPRPNRSIYSVENASARHDGRVYRRNDDVITLPRRTKGERVEYGFAWETDSDTRSERDLFVTFNCSVFRLRTVTIVENDHKKKTKKNLNPGESLIFVLYVVCFTLVMFF